MDGGRFGLLPSRGITPSMEGRSAEREAVPTGTNAEAVFSAKLPAGVERDPAGGDTENGARHGRYHPDAGKE